MGPVPRWFIAGVILILAVPILTVLLNYSPLGGMVTAALRSRAGVEVSSFHLRLIPRPGIELRDIAMTSASEPDAVFRASRAVLSLRLAPLFQKRVAFVEIRVAQPKLVVRRDSGGRWHLPFIPTTPHERDAVRTTDGFTLEWTLPDVEVQGGEVTVIDDAARGTPETFVLTDVHATIRSHLLRRNADVAITAALGDGGIAVHGLVSLLRMEVDPVATAMPLGFDGTVEVTRFDLSPWVTGSEASAQPVDLTAHVALSPGRVGYDAAVSDLQAALRWVRIHGQALIRHAGTGQTAYSVTFSATPLSVAVLLKELPEAWIPANVRAAVAEHELSGAVEVMSASLSGFVGLPAAWNATAKLSEGQGRFGPDRLPVRDVDASLFAKQDHLELLNLSGTVGGMRVSDGRVEVAHLDAAPALDLTLAGSGTVRELVTLLHDFSEGAAGENLLKTITNPAGEVQLSIHAAGALVPEPRVALVSADITVHDLGAYLPHLKLSVEQLDGTVGVRGELIELKHLRGAAGPIAFDAAGNAEMGASPRFDDVTVRLSAQGGDLTRFVLGGVVGDQLVVRGPAYSVLQLSGSVSEPAFTGRLDLTQLEIDAAAVRKRAGVAAAVHFKGKLVRQQLLSLHEVSLVLPSARVDGRAQVRLTRPVQVDLSLESGPLPVAGLAAAFVVDPLEDGVIEAAVTVNGRTDDWRSWPITGRLSLRRGLVAVPGLRDAVRDVDATLELTDGDVVIDRLACRVGGGEVSATGVVTQWASRPSPTLQVESSNLDLTRLFPIREREEHAAGVEALRRWVARGRADVTAKIEQARYQRLTFRTLAAHLHAEPGSAEVELTKGEADQGSVSGRVRLAARTDQPISLDGDLHIDGMPVHHVLSVIDSDPDRLRGLLSFEGRVEGSLQAAVPFLSTVTSREPMHLRLANGRVVHGTVLPKVLKVLNVPALLRGKVDLDRDGIPFDALSATVTADGGVLSSENLRFESPLMKVTGAGTWNVAIDDLNLALAVSPFGAYSDVIGKIPLFGQLLEGDRPGLTTALFEVTGPLDDPNVRYLPIESVAKGLTGYPRLAIDLLRNTVSLPFELMTPAAR